MCQEGGKGRVRRALWVRPAVAEGRRGCSTIRGPVCAHHGVPVRHRRHISCWSTREHSTMTCWYICICVSYGPRFKSVVHCHHLGCTAPPHHRTEGVHTCDTRYDYDYALCSGRRPRAFFYPRQQNMQHGLARPHAARQRCPASVQQCPPAVLFSTNKHISTCRRNAH